LSSPKAPPARSFDTDLLFSAPGTGTTATVDFLRQDGVAISHDLVVPNSGRRTLKVDEIPGLEGAATAAVVRTSGFPIVVERTMRWVKAGTARTRKRPRRA